LAYGAFKSRNPDLTYRKQNDFITLFVSLPFDDASALIFGRLKAQLELTGEMIGIKDLQIAAIALANDLTLVTHNTTEFGRVTGLQIEDWELTT
jgi:tRNA(fMet)-specific endonuclease VapC